MQDERFALVTGSLLGLAAAAVLPGSPAAPAEP